MLGLIDGKIDYNLLLDFRNLAEAGKVKAGMTRGHKDGWGVAGYSENEPTFFGKSESSAAEDPDYDSAVNKASLSKTSVLIAHIRKATSGATTLENTHPFIKDGWIFCHNGTVYDAENISVGELKPEGTTDSERLFYFLIDFLKKEGTYKKIGRAIKKAVSELKSNHNYSSLTFLLANNEYLIAYRDYNEHAKNAEDLENYYTLYISAKKDSIALCSEPIGALSFTPFKNRQLLITSHSEMFETVLN